MPHERIRAGAGNVYCKKTTKGEDCDDNVFSDTNNCCTKPCTAAQRSLTGRPSGAMCPCEDNPKKDWYIDRDGDGYSSVIAHLDAFNFNLGYPYILVSLGPDCDDYDEFINKLNKCGICAVEPANGVCPCKTSVADLTAMFSGLTDAKATLIADLLNKYAWKYGIDTKEKMQHFLAQVGVETANFDSFRESTNFQPKIVMQKFGKYFNGLNNDNQNLDRVNLSSIHITGQKYVDGEKLFNIVYDDRNPNRNRDNLLGNTQDGDGYFFRGRGALHLTGRENYTEFTEFYNSISDIAPKDFTQTPNDLVNNLEIAIHAGMWFFKTKVMGDIKNFSTKVLNTDPSIIEQLTIKISKKVNGGDNSLQDRVNLLNDSKTKIKCN